MDGKNVNVIEMENGFQYMMLKSIKLFFYKFIKKLMN